MSGMGVRKRGFVPSGDAVWVASPQWVPEPGPPRGGGSNWSTAAARREESHCSEKVLNLSVECGRVCEVVSEGALVGEGGGYSRRPPYLYAMGW